MDQLNDSSHVAIMSVVHDSCHGASFDRSCLAGAVAKLKADSSSLWEDVTRGASECDGGGDAGDFCRVARLLVVAEGEGRMFGKVFTGMEKCEPYVA